MAKVLLQSIGSPLEETLTGKDAKANREAMAESARPVVEGRAFVKAGWGEEYVARVHKKGKFTAWERIDRLKDAGIAKALENYRKELARGGK